MEIKQKDDGKKGMFYIEQDEKLLAKMTYVWTGTERIIIDHTEVDDVLRGQSAGKKMVEKAVAFTRENKLKIIPLCPFAKSVLDKDEGYKDVL